MSEDKDNVELIALFPKFRCTDKFGREWILLVSEEMDVPPNDSTITRALADILSTPPLGLKQIEVGKIWLSPGRQITYRFGYPN